jgi:predicted transcriptional regulator
MKNLGFVTNKYKGRCNLFTLTEKGRKIATELDTLKKLCEIK